METLQITSIEHWVITHHTDGTLGHYRPQMNGTLRDYRPQKLNITTLYNKQMKQWDNTHHTDGMLGQDKPHIDLHIETCWTTH